MLTGSARLAALALFLAALAKLEVSSGFFVCTLLNNGLVRSQAWQHWLEAAASEKLLPSGPAQSGMDARMQIEGVADMQLGECTPAAFERLSEGGTRPVVVRGPHRDSPIRNWTVDRLLDLFGNESSLRLEKRIDPKQPDISFGERLRMYQRGEIRQVNQVFFPVVHGHLRQRLMNELGSSLAQDCAGHGSALIPPIAMTLNLYKAYANTSSGVAWHAHNIEAPSTVHVKGKKTWTLVAPQYTPLLRPESSLWGAVLFAQGNPYSYVDWDPIEHLQPMISRIPVQRATLEAGDVLFVPAGWWHNTENERADTDVISLVFSHLSAGPTMLKTHAPFALLGWYNMAYVAAVEIAEAARRAAGSFQSSRFAFGKLSRQGL